MIQTKYFKWTQGKVLHIHIMIWNMPSVHHHHHHHHHHVTVVLLCNLNLIILINSANMAKSV